MVACCLVLSTVAQEVFAQDFSRDSRKAIFESDSLKGIDISYDSFEYVGQNLIARGHVVIQWLDLQVTADNALINLDSNDLEVAGNVTFTSKVVENKTLSLEEYDELKNDPYQMVEFIKYRLTPTGNQLVEVKITYNDIVLKTDRAAINLDNGTVQFKDFQAKFGSMYAVGERAERNFNGKFTVWNTKITTCNYLLDDHDHYGIFSKKAVLSPREANRGLLNYNSDQGDHSVWTVNSFLELWDVPVFWFPALYKPMDISSFGGIFEFGHDSSWGTFFRTSKNFQLLDEPYVNTNLMLDYYEKRGLGYGISTDVITGESSTELFYYGISDRNPYEYFDRRYDRNIHQPWYQGNSRLGIPHYRYEFKLANLTHITPTMDFRGQVDVLSDFNFLRDYFYERYNESIEPPTFVSLENQWERMTASLYSNVRVNDFATTVEHLPQIKLNFQRQELFGGLYYQGETSFDYLSMDWRHFDFPSTSRNDVHLKDYSSARWDMLNMFYYPMKFMDINVIPRAGIRLTAYSQTSERAVSNEDLTNMFMDNKITGQPDYNIDNKYDSNGGAKFRVTGEVGVEVNTKIYKTWQNVRNSYWELDGLRHVLIPYINYTYIPAPNVEKEHLFYFDEIDRIDEQNFIRFGAINRLQTRRNDQLQEILSLETFWDYFFYKEKGFDHAGNLGVVLNFTPMDKLRFSTEVLFDMGQCDSDHKTGPIRNGRKVKRPGLSWKYIDRLFANVSYDFAPDWRIYANYQYSDAYNQRSVYSMGSQFTQIS